MTAFTSAEVDFTDQFPATEARLRFPLKDDQTMAASPSKSPRGPQARPPLETRMALLKEFAYRGILLKQDAHLPDVVGFLAGGPIRGSWWSHPGAHALYDALQEFTQAPDALSVKLVGGKDTYVHRRLWPALLGVAREGAAWQTDGLSPGAEALLAEIGSAGQVQATGASAKEIQLRLLAHGRPVHTASGRHALILEPWSEWQRRKKAKPLDPGAGRAQLENALAEMGGKPELLPWRRRKRTVKRMP